MLTSLLQWLGGVPPALDYAVIGALVLAEAALFVGFVLPGETAALVGGVLAAGHRLSLPVLLVLVVVCAVVGDTIGYEVGRSAGPRLLRAPLLRRRAESLDAAQARLRRGGGRAVFLARFTAFLRAVMPGLAGMSGMPYRRFVAANAAGAVVWGVGVTVAGYLAGSSYQRLAGVLGTGSTVLLAVFAGVLLLGWFRRRHRAKAAGGDAERDDRPHDRAERDTMAS